MSDNISLNVMIVSSHESNRAFFAQFFSESQAFFLKSGKDVRECELIDTTDIVIIDSPLCDESGIALACEIAEETEACVILLVPASEYEIFSKKTQDYCVYVLDKPINRQQFVQTIKIISITQSRMRKYEKRVAHLNEKVDEMKLVNHAKWLLINKLGLTEQEAHKTVEKQAMNMRISKREVAQHIIKTYQN